MSALAGCLWFDGRSARSDDIVASTRAAAHRARAPFRICCAGPAALAFASAARSDDPQPLVDEASGLTVVVDGRLDNRRDLERALGLPDHAPAGRLVLRAFDRWGIGAGAHLLGDFVFVVWDARAARLVCVRDPLGQRPLFYATSARALAFGSEPQQVLAHPAVERVPNEGVVAEHLAGLPSTISETLWRDVYRLPPAHALVACAGTVQTVRYWDFDPEARVDEVCADGFARRLQELFRSAVDCRVRDAGSIGVFLSGGVDSSAVAGAAAARSGCAGSVLALSVTFPGRACDESPYIDDVVRLWAMRSEQLPAATPDAWALGREVDRYLDLPAYPNGLVLNRLRCRAAELGLDVVLTGYGGDEWFGGAPRRGLGRRIVAAVRQLAQDRARERRLASPALLRAAIGPLVPEAVRRALGPLCRNRVGFEWIRPEFAARASLRDRLEPAPAPPFPAPTQRAIYRAVTGAAQVIADELEDRAAHAAGIDQRHPFYDRRIAEFGLALPDALRCNAGETKVLLRKALGALLPPSVVRRRDKAEFSCTFVEAIVALGGRRIFDRLRSEDAGWVDGRVVRRRCEEMIELYSRGDASYISLSNGLWEIAGLELWLERAGL